jgi:hypothetical protein
LLGLLSHGTQCHRLRAGAICGLCPPVSTINEESSPNLPTPQSDAAFFNDASFFSDEPVNGKLIKNKTKQNKTKQN